MSLPGSTPARPARMPRPRPTSTILSRLPPSSARLPGVSDPEVLTAAVLHDTVEDTAMTPAQLQAEFGGRVAALVAECTDDKSLLRAERKRLQVVNASHKSADAKLIKLADKTANVADIIRADWPPERKREYLDWAEKVAAGLRGSNPALDAAFDSALGRARAELPAC